MHTQCYYTWHLTTRILVLKGNDYYGATLRIAPDCLLRARLLYPAVAVPGAGARGGPWREGEGCAGFTEAGTYEAHDAAALNVRVLKDVV